VTAREGRNCSYSLRVYRSHSAAQTDELFRYIDLKLAALGLPVHARSADPSFLELAGPLLRNYHQKDQLLGDRLCPADARIQAYLDETLADVGGGIPRLPASTFVLDRPGLARAMSLPAGRDLYTSPYLKSYRVAQGVLHNPKADRRTTVGIFHVVEGGLPVPADKLTVPKPAFLALLRAALAPPPDVLVLPFTAGHEDTARLWVTLLIRPLVCPATGHAAERRMETRFFAPASLVSNLDFVESIFGNGGDPYLPENDAALDLQWTGHTGCVILAPHLVGLPKKDLGLPHVDQATPAQRRDGMCWKDAAELYNDGSAFKVTCRDERGVIVTIIADNYYGYCKKEVKTQISYAANLFGRAEEEHAGGAVAFPAYVLGQEFYAGRTVLTQKVVFEEAMAHLGPRVEVRPERYAVDRTYPDVFYVPENADFLVRDGVVRWPHGDTIRSLVLRHGETYVLPWGTKIRLEKQAGGSAWRLIASRADGVLCHKPCTVSGGGKSEISKSLGPIILKGPVFVGDFQRDFDAVEAALARDFSEIYRISQDTARAARPILSPQRSLGSVIKLLTPSPDYTDAHNAWVRALPPTIRQLIVTVKRYYRPEWGREWRKYFSVDRSDGTLGHELKFDNQKLVGNYLRVGYDPDGSWRIYKLRPDFNPADKVQAEDDITASVVLPREQLSHLDPLYPHQSVKLVANCEARLFQRPDDAIHRGFDRDAERDLSSPNTFLSNFEPLTRADAQALVDRVVDFDQYTDPMKALLGAFAAAPPTEFVVSSAHPRMVGGAPSKNPRYLQMRPDLANPREAYLAEIGTRLAREIPSDQPAYFPVNAVLAGRRNNPPDRAAGLPPLAVFSPIHYQELPELFMDFICSLTGKSPSTTGFGSEGALTKGPFNALWPVIDVNNALVSFALTGYGGFTTAAGYVGPAYRVDHDNSMLVPEIWCRMRVHEREPEFLISNGLLEPVRDFVHQGRPVLASRLGYRITTAFVDRFLGRIFEMPAAVFPEELLKPELQDLDVFVEGVDAIVEAQQRVALHYFEDGSVEAACPPIRALLHIMAHGHYEGLTIDAAPIRLMFTREAVLGSAWYRERLAIQQQRDIALWQKHVASTGSADARAGLARVSAPDYVDSLVGTIGADPLRGYKNTP
jgi:phosphoenolpyruvate carboxykinase (diphosphate)